MQSGVDQPASTAIQSQENDSHCKDHPQAHDTSYQTDGNGKSSFDYTSNSLGKFPPVSDTERNLFSPAEESITPLGSGWVEDFLIECYLNRYSDVDPGADFSSTDRSSNIDYHLSQSQAVQMDVSNHNMHCPPKDQSFVHCQFNGNTVDSNSRLETKSTFSHGKDSSRMTSFDEDSDVTEDLEEGVFALQEDENKRLKCDVNVEGLKNEERLDEDQRDVEFWLAQYGQVTRTDAETKLSLGAINLWNWRTAVHKGKSKQKQSVYLVGRVAATINKLHPALQYGSGFIKTSCICAVNHDLVKVSSGELYRLREPSSKHILSVAMYDSSDPTKDWDFPRFPTSVFEEFESKSKPSHDTLIAKPFVPNKNHHRYWHVSAKEKRPSVQEDKRVLTIREFTAKDQRQIYRDRAKERRDLYGGYGGLGMQDKEELSTETTFMESSREDELLVVKKPVAKRLLESMGWTEGDSLGKDKDGIKEPLQGRRNIGRTGIGWTSATISL